MNTADSLSTPCNREEKPRCFLVMSQPRCGTHLIRGYLNSHPEIHCEGEIYHFNQGRRHRESMPEVRTAEELFFALRSRWAAQHFGALVHDHFGTPEFRGTHGWSHRKLPRWREKPVLIWLSRENRLAQYASWVMARQTSQWMRYERAGEDGSGENGGRSEGAPGAIHGNPEELVEWLRRWEARRRQWRALLADFDSVDLTYEALCRDPKRECAKVFARLGVAHVAVEANTLKQRGYRIPNVFTNFEEMIEVAIARLGREKIGEFLGRGVTVRESPE